MWVGVILFLSVSMVMLLLRAIMGPSIFDRILAANIFTTNVVVLISVVAVIKNSPSYIDIALVYASLNFVATLGLLRFFKYGTFKGAFLPLRYKLKNKKLKRPKPKPKLDDV